MLRRGRHQGTLPTGLAELLLSRVERVVDAAQQVLRAAAVVGGSADDLVRAASGLPDDAYELAVREAVGQQLLAPDGPDGYGSGTRSCARPCAATSCRASGPGCTPGSRACS